MNERNRGNFVLNEAKNVGDAQASARLFNEVQEKICRLQPFNVLQNKSTVLINKEAEAKPEPEGAKVDCIVFKGDTPRPVEAIAEQSVNRNVIIEKERRTGTHTKLKQVAFIFVVTACLGAPKAEIGLGKRFYLPKVKKMFDNQDNIPEYCSTIKAALMSEFSQVVKGGLHKIFSSVKKFFLLVFLLAVVGGGLYLWVCNWTYSKGTRAGTLIKISYKGVAFKTYEGQLNLGGFRQDGGDGVSGNIWEFSVWEDEVYNTLQNYEGKQVKLYYREKYKAMPWQGDTEYFVYKVEQVE